MKNLILLGPPGSGKGTQSELLKKKGYNHISTGDLLRAEVASGSDLGKEISNLIDNGNFVSDEMAMDLINKNCDFNKGSYIFDGMPRTLNQAKLLLKEVLKNEEYLVLYFDISDKKLKDRLVNRRTCESCGKIFNVKDIDESSLKCGCGSTKFKHRKDDTIYAVPQRLKNYHKSTMPLIEFFEKENKLIKINADQNSAQVFSDVLSEISDWQ